jgi:XTP/dITP diphosphohydrolase
VIEVTFVSSNPGKLREVRALLAPFGVRVRWLRRTLPEPQAEDLEEVARWKLASLGRRPGYTLVEDSGLFIPSLAGFPGVYSAHFLRVWGFPPILELLKRRGRSASYRAVAALAHGKESRVFFGEVHGRIARSPRGSNGFGYDPIFVPKGHAKTFGELPAATKDRLSHRAEAMRQVGAYLARQSGRRRGRRAKGERTKGLA